MILIVNHEVINIMSPIGSLIIVYKYFVTCNLMFCIDKWL
jgi:hypothetical protein